MKEVLNSSKNIICTDEEAVQILETIVGSTWPANDLLQLLTLLRNGNLWGIPKVRKLRVGLKPKADMYNTYRYYPELILRGNWLRDAGFEVKDSGHIITMNKLIIITHEAMPKVEPVMSAYMKRKVGYLGQ